MKHINSIAWTKAHASFYTETEQQNNRITSVIYFVREIISKDGYYFTAKIHCNRCAVVVWTSEEYAVKAPPYFGSLVKWGKKSKWVGEEHELHLCESCYQAIVATFKLPVTKGDKILGVARD